MIARERILDRRTDRICGGIENFAGRKRLSECERIARIQGAVAEIAVHAAVDLVAAGFCDDVHGRARGAAQIRAVVASVHLKFLDRVLAHGEAHAAGIVARFAAVNRDAVAAAVAAVKGKAALRSLLDAKILIVREPGGVGDTGQQQGEVEVIAAVNRKILDILLRDGIGLAATFGFDDGRSGGDFHH